MNKEWYAWHQRPQSPRDRAAYGRKPDPARRHPEKAPVREDVIQTYRLEIERKTFVLALKENVLGRLLRITEASASYSNTIIIPAAGLPEFKALLEEIIRASESNPPPAA